VTVGSRMPIRSGFPLVALIAAYAVTVAPSPAQEAAMTAAPSPAGTYAAAVARIAAAAPEAMRRQHAPGMALALVDRRGTIAILTFGEADIEHHVPVTARTRFGIGSITKSMTTIALMQARDRGAFDPRAPVTRYLPWFSVHTRWRALTGRDLLTHTSGLPDAGSASASPMTLRCCAKPPPALLQARAGRTRTSGSKRSVPCWRRSIIAPGTRSCATMCSRASG